MDKERIRNKIKALEGWIAQLEAIIKGEEERRPGYTSFRRADLFYADCDLDRYRRWLTDLSL